jgi:hypothetical protein
MWPMPRLLGRNPKAETASMNDEAMVFDPEKNQFFQLNPTAAFLWDQLVEPRTVERLTEQVSQHFEDASTFDVARDIDRLVEQMLAHQLIVVLERN